LSGTFEGVLKAKQKIEMHPPANFKGTCITPTIKIEEGVIFEGESKTPD
jgi:cytoskeletal protein CcmA (bactofilin family)